MVHTPLYEDWVSRGTWLDSPARLEALRRSDFLCNQCGQQELVKGSIQVHHLTYDRLGRERPEDLLPLCISCHKREHKRLREEKWKRRVMAFGASRYGPNWEDSFDWDDIEDELRDHITHS